ncbi:MAG TPA: S-methyl-5'-thioadenosine phosphorylase [Acidobacteriaceae bacterium]|nr:S-methyl-5'-thioadenosine phosphorylase [Acidobacteriaceae bacterium]
MFRAEIGILGGSGLYHMPGLTNAHEEQISTPFGDPSDWLTFGELHGRRVAFLARHGRGHGIVPSDINYRANIYAMKQAGVNAILSISAVGSLKEEHKPGIFLVPDQYIDRTYARRSTFFGPDVVAHVSMADPVCAELGSAIMTACGSLDVHATRGGTYVCIEGPQFSTKAESNLYRSWGADMIGMTNLQEAKLAREAEICYATLAMVTDYDCWHPGHDSVTTEQVVAILNQNNAAALKVMDAVVAALPAKRNCHCQSALKGAILTRPALISLATRQKLGLLLEKYLP